MLKNKISKIMIIYIVAFVVTGNVAIAQQARVLQNRFSNMNRISQINNNRFDYFKVYLLRGRVVSAVTSPVTSAVPSIVVSEVTSPEGVSEVASVVVSPVGSAVASAVAVDSETARQVDKKRLQVLTARTLESISRQDYIANPSFFMRKAQEEYERNPEKFALSEREKQEILRIYENANKPVKKNTGHSRINIPNIRRF